MLVTLSDLKEHLRVDHDDEDVTIDGLIASAQGHVENLIGKAASEIDGALHPPLKQAVLMLAAHWFECRETSSPEQMRTVPHGVAEIVNEYREFSF